MSKLNVAVEALEFGINVLPHDHSERLQIGISVMRELKDAYKE